MLKGLKLSEAEKSGVKIGWAGSGKVGMIEPRAMAKLFSEKPAYAYALAHSLGRAWSPMKGVECRDMCGNIHLFTFKQESDQRKAPEGGPWTFEKDLLLIEEFVLSKRIEDYEFKYVTMWVRLFDLPLGDMHRNNGELIGDLMGETVDVDVGADGMAIGKFMRIRVKMLVAESLMRDSWITVTKEEGGKKKDERIWVRFEYEYLPNFCFVCGVIGHGAQECKIKLKSGENPQFGKGPKAFIESRKGGGEERGGWSNGRGGDGSSSMGYRLTAMDGGVEGREATNNPRGKIARGRGSNISGGSGKDDEVLSPLKNLPVPTREQLNSRKQLTFRTSREAVIDPNGAGVNDRVMEEKIEEA